MRTAPSQQEEAPAPQQRQPDPQGAFIPPFPWGQGLDADSLSTKRGFVFQYPPFPMLERTGPEVVHAPRTAGLYVHIPFCPYRCSYCYYAVETGQPAGAVEQYLGALEREMELVAREPVVRQHRLRTVFFGGGTPTALDGAQLTRVVEALRQRWDLSGVEEFSCESDPTTLTLEKLQAMRALGINRLSIGVQSFSTEVNLLNERKHSADQSLTAIRLARGAGFDNVNLDLICGLIGETDGTWHDTVDTLLEVAPEHVTIYLFSFRPQTSAYVHVKHGRMPMPPEEPARIEMFLYARQRLLDRGYVQTTPNCFVREPRYEQVHQRNAWSSLPLIGLGNSAYSFVDDCVTQNHRSTSMYQRMVGEGRIPVEIGQRLNARELMIRYCVLRLKQLRIMRADFRQRFGFEVMAVIGPEVEELERLGLLEVTPQAVALTPRGIIYVDDVCRTLYPRDVRERLASQEAAPPSPLVRSLI